MGERARPSEIILQANDFHIRIVIYAEREVAKTDPAKIGDVIVESALNVIMDCEDSVAAVDGADKAAVYRNWLGLMTGEIRAEFNKNGKRISRALNPDIPFCE